MSGSCCDAGLGIDCSPAVVNTPMSFFQKLPLFMMSDIGTPVILKSIYRYYCK
jgi:hypothetical protein